MSIPATVCTFIIGTETDKIIMMSENKLNFHHFICCIHLKITSQSQHFRLTSFENLDISKISKLFSTFGEIHILPSAPSSYSQPTNDQIAKSSFSISSSDNNNFLSDIFNFQIPKFQSQTAQFQFLSPKTMTKLKNHFPPHLPTTTTFFPPFSIF